MKILIVLDTNTINNNDYKNCRPGGDYFRIVDYIKNNKLQQDISLAITETSIKELYRHKRDSYRSDLQLLNNAGQKLQGTPKHLIQITAPIQQDYEKEILINIESELSKYNFVKIPRLSKSKKIVAFDSIVEHCNEKQDRLNDQLIIEEIRYHRNLKQYGRIILYTTNRKDFEDYLPDNIEMITSWEDLKTTLDTIFLIADTPEEASFKEFLTTEYAEELIKDTYKESTGTQLNLKEVKYGYMVSEIEDEESFFVVNFNGIDTKVKHKISGEIFFNSTNTITHIETHYQ